MEEHVLGVYTPFSMEYTAQEDGGLTGVLSKAHSKQAEKTLFCFIWAVPILVITKSPGNPGTWGV